MNLRNQHRHRVEVFDFYEANRAGRRAAITSVRQVLKDLKAAQHQSTQAPTEFPKRAWGPGGERRPKSLHGTGMLRTRGVPTTAHTGATAYPYVAGTSLGADGLYIGRDLNGGGAFCFDPWQLYERGVISGMSMILFGQVGMGKSSLAKSLAVRLVLAGRKLSVASDRKGEWTKVVRALGGSVIQVGPGMGTRINPLDPGTRPARTAQGEPLTDEGWALMVRTRRMAILVTLAKILTNRELSPAEHHVLSLALDTGVDGATTRAGTVVIPDVIAALEADKTHPDRLVAEACSVMAMTLHRMTTGDLAGMFDGETTAHFAADAPATSIDTSALQGASPEAIRVVNACSGAWTEAMVTTSDGGQRLVIYEEGWDNISSEADLRRMVEGWKLARAYGIFNVLILHKVSDLDMAGDRGSKMAAMAKSLLADADVKVIYRQDASALRVTTDELELSDRERSLLKYLDEGVGLWRLGGSSFQVKNDLDRVELGLFNTDQRLTTTTATTSAREARA
ncbi:conjugal transfer protein TraC [Citricoccus sp. SGAir0253]|uniref:conjugal transfer protein TraC n=1 Tax=Citricoccus sp. SGAir0253 TaxID=2567881 RepID=UPI001FEFCFBA|nr:conjugal transfer protein TraC [Citricoccus sp. SGAir0253]